MLLFFRKMYSHFLGKETKFYLKNLLEPEERPQIVKSLAVSPGKKGLLRVSREHCVHGFICYYSRA